MRDSDLLTGAKHLDMMPLGDDMTRTEIKSASSLASFLRPLESRSTKRILGESLDVVCTLAMGSALPSTEDGAAQGFARVRLVRAFPSLSFGGKEKTIAVWHS